MNNLWIGRVPKTHNARTNHVRIAKPILGTRDARLLQSLFQPAVLPKNWATRVAMIGLSSSFLRNDLTSGINGR